ncbi:MAG: type I glyceraldehyde-3-phosphate dehydrogenase [Patescibacteria group bacterium]|jgi:glyceraldehyde 3-phosphate dehydrogenase|nr:type I glyceraldehyde-3-phosphate dehydrogenase [Patescibacteria group bacterium]
MATKIAINGFGRIGRAAFKAALNNKNLEVVAINDLMDNKTLAHLLQYDTVYGQYSKPVTATKDGLKVAGKLYPVFAEKDPTKLPWKELNVAVVLECTGVFRDQQSAGSHLTAGAKRVIISAPDKDGSTQNIVLGTKVSANCLKSKKCNQVISMASCTTNCISPVMQVLAARFGIAKAMMTTIHSYTADQNLVDGPHKDWRRARAAAQNIVPTTTGAAVATTKVVGSLDNLFDGIAVRVPTVCASVSDITALVKRQKVTAEEINDEFKKAVKDPLYKNVLAVSAKPLVSSDFIGNPHSAIVDLEFTKVVGGNLVKVLAWYDNEWGYSLRLTELAQQLG